MALKAESILLPLLPPQAEVACFTTMDFWFYLFIYFHFGRGQLRVEGHSKRRMINLLLEINTPDKALETLHRLPLFHNESVAFIHLLAERLLLNFFAFLTLPRFLIPPFTLYIVCQRD